MTKKIFLLIIISVIAFFVFKLGFFSHTPFLSMTNYFKRTFQETQKNFADFSELYFYQADTIRRLKKENKYLKEDNIVLDTFAAEVVNLSKFKSYEGENSPKVETVRAIAYASLPDFNKVWIDFKDFNSSKIYGLIYNGTTAGIVVEKNGQQSLALLNGDSKCSYSVYVGSREYPGIAMGKRSDLMVVKYIPSWADIEVGDEVFTSGLDNIFFEGIKVGTVKNVRNFNVYKEVEIEPFYNSLKPDYFYIITETR